MVSHTLGKSLVVVACLVLLHGNTFSNPHGKCSLSLIIIFSVVRTAAYSTYERELNLFTS
jgi:uncharacterized membrane protein YGL010W